MGTQQLQSIKGFSILCWEAEKANWHKKDIKAEKETELPE